jgi:RNA polymerase sigma-70 factor (ECF subfamily)
MSANAAQAPVSADRQPSPHSARTPASDPIASGQEGHEFRTELVSLIPHLRAFARMLTGERDSADDLAQETLAKAWRHQGAFQPGTNLRAWLFTITRNAFYASRRRARREAPFDQQAAEALPSRDVDQFRTVELSQTLRAVELLPGPLREALLLVAASGCSYDEVASICGCPVGTVKSRVSRARHALAAILESAPLGAATDGSLSGFLISAQSPAKDCER